eukprot:4049353-Prymnesium_polylepis.1
MSSISQPKSCPRSPIGPKALDNVDPLPSPMSSPASARKVIKSAQSVPTFHNVETPVARHQ